MKLHKTSIKVNKENKKRNLNRIAQRKVGCKIKPMYVPKEKLYSKESIQILSVIIRSSFSK